MFPASFTDLVNEAVAEGYQMGINLFMESLESEIKKQTIYEQFNPEDVIKALFIEANLPLDGLQRSTIISENDYSDIDNIDEDKLDQLLDELGDDDDIDN